MPSFASSGPGTATRATQMPSIASSTGPAALLESRATQPQSVREQPLPEGLVSHSESSTSYSSSDEAVAVPITGRTVATRTANTSAFGAQRDAQRNHASSAATAVKGDTAKHGSVQGGVGRGSGSSVEGPAPARSLRSHRLWQQRESSATASARAARQVQQSLENSFIHSAHASNKAQSSRHVAHTMFTEEGDEEAEEVQQMQASRSSAKRSRTPASMRQAGLSSVTTHISPSNRSHSSGEELPSQPPTLPGKATMNAHARHDNVQWRAPAASAPTRSPSPSPSPPAKLRTHRLWRERTSAATPDARAHAHVSDALNSWVHKASHFASQGHAEEAVSVSKAMEEQVVEERQSGSVRMSASGWEEQEAQRPSSASTLRQQTAVNGVAQRPFKPSHATSAPSARRSAASTANGAHSSEEDDAHGHQFQSLRGHRLWRERHTAASPAARVQARVQGAVSAWAGSAAQSWVTREDGDVAEEEQEEEAGLHPGPIPAFAGRAPAVSAPPATNLNRHTAPRPPVATTTDRSTAGAHQPAASDDSEADGWGEPEGGHGVGAEVDKDAGVTTPAGTTRSQAFTESIAKLKNHRVWRERESNASPVRRAQAVVDTAISSWASKLSAATTATQQTTTATSAASHQAASEHAGAHSAEGWQQQHQGYSRTGAGASSYSGSEAASFQEQARGTSWATARGSSATTAAATTNAAAAASASANVAEGKQQPGAHSYDRAQSVHRRSTQLSALSSQEEQVSGSEVELSQAGGLKYDRDGMESVVTANRRSRCVCRLCCCDQSTLTLKTTLAMLRQLMHGSFSPLHFGLAPLLHHIFFIHTVPTTNHKNTILRTCLVLRVTIFLP